MRQLLMACLIAYSLPLAALELERYPTSYERQVQAQSVRNHHLVGSAIRKVTGRLRARQELWLEGELQRQVLQLPEGHTVDDAMAHYLRQLEKLRADFLFQCAGRDCGPSNLWANDVFKVAQLYGPNKDQRYALALVRGEVPRYITLYAIRRGNGRVLVLVDQLITPDREQFMTPDHTSVLRLLDRRGFYDLQGNWADNPTLSDEPAYRFLRELLAQETTLKLVLGGQVAAQRLTETNWETLVARSEAQAVRVRDALVAEGIEPGRLRVQGLGTALSQETGETDPGLRLLRLY